MDIERAAFDHYDGSRLFEKVADKFQMSVDLVNFLIVQGSSLLLASILRTYLHPTKVSVTIRHAYSIAFGLLFGYFCFGSQSLHITLLPGLCYVILRFYKVDNVQRYILVFAMTYLSCLHLHRQLYEYGSYSLDITGPLMIITQKVTSLAYSLVDGRTNDKKALTPNQQYHAIYELPNPLEYFSYMLNFEGLMAGPLVFYRDYFEFIEGRHISKHSLTSEVISDTKLPSSITIEPSPHNAVIRKLLGCVACAYIFMNFRKMYPLQKLKDDKFVDGSSFFYRLWYVMMATTVVRFKYYYAWLFGDAICNAAGLGFNGYAKDGVPKWDLISNIEIFNFEFGTNFRNCINSWNIGTNHWLRMVVYERLPNSTNATTLRTVLTFMMSALWHGFYPGYYVTFATGAFIVTAARIARKLFRDHFQGSKQMKIIYDIATCLVTRVFMAYVTFPFVLLELSASLRLYIKLFMCLHLLAILVILAGRKLIKTTPRQQQKVQSSANTAASDDVQEHNNKYVTNIKIPSYSIKSQQLEYNNGNGESKSRRVGDHFETIRRHNNQPALLTTTMIEDKLMSDSVDREINVQHMYNNDIPAALSYSKIK